MRRSRGRAPPRTGSGGVGLASGHQPSGLKSTPTPSPTPPDTLPRIQRWRWEADEHDPPRREPQQPEVLVLGVHEVVGRIVPERRWRGRDEIPDPPLLRAILLPLGDAVDVDRLLQVAADVRQ